MKESYGGQWKEILRNFLNYTKYLFHSNVYIYIYIYIRKSSSKDCFQNKCLFFFNNKQWIND